MFLQMGEMSPFKNWPHLHNGAMTCPSQHATILLVRKKKERKNALWPVYIFVSKFLGVELNTHQRRRRNTIPSGKKNICADSDLRVHMF